MIASTQCIPTSWCVYHAAHSLEGCALQVVDWVPHLWPADMPQSADKESVV